MSQGYLYCFSNPHIKLLKVGMTERTPDVRLSEANKQSNEWTPGDFKLEFAMKVSDPASKEKLLHTHLAAKRIPKTEFFDISLDELKSCFTLMGGDPWPLSTVSKHAVSSDTQQSELVSDLPPSNKKQRGPARGCRTMASQFKHGQRIRHYIRKVEKTWYAKYDAKSNRIVGSNGEVYNSPSGFAEKHMKVDHPTVKHERDGWKYGEYEVNGAWVSFHTLPCTPSCTANCRKT